ncbi:glycosyltransferase family 4 protein [Candidatus Nomurabacteria bacterium]|uniref:Glycosyltransferase family 4 protein n=1 Tax=candidate division WWE3 bacterium TaxID=2053526 RepID=A0A955DZW3_UNCKA|nr:glycosyltransferase family 4 protein [candidate division WWE3 bacterium]MCB9824156.1 glycosyltransferase family 4 protein [Candidatus Nomurabacteria bacterium]MCB9826873.1 glycosyltransferase family 4 protein [Candidatus Nomurabacteria bacterium]MCB9828097.1 glycosyltransferase family 4 protein [Candidatus Nomurabacteria bacterium]HXK52459.1 glycosyltransferase family 4 protein [bacterium]
MKILRIIYDWPPPSDGLAPHPYELSKAQIDLGHEVSVFSARWPRQGPPADYSGKIKLIHFLGNSSLPFRTPAQGLMLVTVAPLLFFRYWFWRLKKSNSVDVIHSHGHFALWIYLYRYFLRKFYKRAKELRTPLVVHFHNTVAGRFEAMNKSGKELKYLTEKIDWPLARLSDETAVKIADACIFVSLDVFNEAKKHYNVDAKKCFILESGVNPDLFKPTTIEEKDKTRKDLGLDPKDVVILHHGAMIDRKNTHCVVEALKYLPPHYKLLLVGPWPDSKYRQTVDLIIEENRLSKRIVFVGYTPNEEVPIAYQASDIFVLPSSWEGLPKVAVQGLACGIPVLGSAFKIDDSVSGVFYLHDTKPETIARQIKEIIEGRPFVDVDLVSRIYSWRQRALQLNKVYDFVSTARSKNTRI